MFQIHEFLAKGLAFGALASSVLINASAASPATETVLYSFCSQGPPCTDGVGPYAGLAKIQGKLYGTTAGEYGNVYAFDLKTGAETALYDFTGEYGADPFAGLLDVKGTLYGTTQWGGGYALGTVFSINRKTGALTVLHSFGFGGSDGTGPYAGLVDVKGTLYGTTVQGGTLNVGVVYSVDVSSGTETVLHSFGNSPDGANPYAGLINVKGLLYGTTELGGAYGYGTVFSIDPTSGTETVLYSFGNGTDGQKPAAGLIDVKGTLYGTTIYGGSYGNGTVFAIDPKTGSETMLYSFGYTGGDGAYPYAGLIYKSGTLYGTTSSGGYGSGTVFSVDVKTDSETVLYNFGGGQDGTEPYGGLVDVNGTLYGTTYGGGAYYSGTIFAIRP